MAAPVRLKNNLWRLKSTIIWWRGSFEPPNEKRDLRVEWLVILQKRVHSHSVGPEGGSLPEAFLCDRTAKVLTRLPGCAGAPEPSLFTCVISTLFSTAASFYFAEEDIIILMIKCEQTNQPTQAKHISSMETKLKIGISNWNWARQSQKNYRKFPKYSDTQNIGCNHSKIWTMWLYHRVMSPNDADGMANSVDPDQTAPLGPDQTAPLGAVWSGSALFAQTYLSENLGPLQ